MAWFKEGDEMMVRFAKWVTRKRLPKAQHRIICNFHRIHGRHTSSAWECIAQLQAENFSRHTKGVGRMCRHEHYRCAGKTTSEMLDCGDIQYDASDSGSP